MHGGTLAETVGLGFEGVVLDDSEARAERVSDPAGTLLDDMRQFVAEQLLAGDRVGLKPARGEIDVGADGEGDRADPLGLRPDIYPHIGEIGAKRRLHLAAHPVRQRPPAARGEPERPALDRKRTAGAVSLHHSRSPGKRRYRRTRRPRRESGRRRTPQTHRRLCLNRRRGRRESRRDRRRQFRLAAEK
ncbi:MAG TPA: hypothetical protein VGI28_07445 [Stellaceae bacterium]